MTKAAGAPDGPPVWRAEDGLHLDVRGLPCPEPLVTVLRWIDGGEAGDRLTAHLSQEPLLLYAELDERGWRHGSISPSGETDEVGHVVIELFRPRP